MVTKVLRTCPLKAQIAAGAGLEHEPEVDVHQPPVAVQQDVAVVPVLDVQQEARDRVSAAQRTEFTYTRRSSLQALIVQPYSATAFWLLARPLSFVSAAVRCHVQQLHPEL